VDSAGRIYVTDSGNCRVIPMDNMSGKNWTSLGTCGAGNQQFNNPTGLFVYSIGKIYIADTGNNRIVQVTDIVGDNWTVFGTQGSSAGQFYQPGGLAVDPSGRIYIGDGGSGRVVRVDNITGANWTGLGGFSSLMGAVILDTGGRIYIADTYNNRIVRTDDMSGANWTELGGSGAYQLINPYGVTVDPYGTIYIADSHDYRLVVADDMTGSAWTPTARGERASADSTRQPPSLQSRPSRRQPCRYSRQTSLTFSDTVVGVPSAPQSITMTNIGSATLDIISITPTGDYSQTNTCGSALPAAQTCSITVTFTPTVGGTRAGGSR
jgi:sugar lactone lactonase YvrE